MIYIDSSALKSWGCRELYRQQFVEGDHGIAPLRPNLNYELGKAIHLAVEYFWKGEPEETARDAAYDYTNTVDARHFTPWDASDWRKKQDMIPDLVGAYYNDIEYCPEKLLWVEKEWSFAYNTNVILCGRVDRVMLGPTLVDVKTASEISRYGTPWKKQYREDSLLNPQFGLYDWYLDKTGKSPKGCYLEVILKPYGSKKARVEIIDLNEIVTELSRKRFRQQLAWNLEEISNYHRYYSSQKPWPMNSNMCNGKYGPCPMFERCVYGSLAKIEEKFGPRIEHLDIRRLETGGNSPLRGSPALKEE